MNLVIGYIKKGALSVSDLDNGWEALKEIFQEAYKTPWQRLSSNAKFILSLFTYMKRPIHRDALCAISQMDKGLFDKSITEIYDWNLLIVDIQDQYYSLHSTLNAFLEFEESVVLILTKETFRVRFIEFYTIFVKNNVRRPEPNALYWNALVSERMVKIDRHWPSILQALNWAKEDRNHDKLFLDMISHLVHFMDSRFYNNERIVFVKHAIEICDQHGEFYLKFLLQVDALAWTCIEEGDLDSAYKYISIGVGAIEDFSDANEEVKNMKALAETWFTRIKLIKGQTSQHEILHNLYNAFESSTQPWIRSRVYQTIGDVYYKFNDFENALHNYEKAALESKSYGGEGEDYRLGPRMGFTFLSLTSKSPENLKKAELIFKDLELNNFFLLNRLYGRYGLCLVELEKSKNAVLDMEFICKQLIEIEAEIEKRSKTNILINLIRDYKLRNSIFC